MTSRIARVTLFLALAAAPAFGQCAMCYSSAKGATTSGQRALTKAILTLLIPPVGIMGVIVGFAFLHNRNGQTEAMSYEPPRSEAEAE